MLINLSIKNYALIENLSVSFQDNLSIITGETGAGKSILLGALGLVLGKRADSSTLKDASKKCIIEARFSISDYKLNTFFEEKDLDFEEETIIRREILPSGKSRAFINDTPTTIQTLQLLSEKLIDVHSQHQTVQLSDVNFQFYIIDALSANTGKIESYKRGLVVFNKLTKELKKLKQEQEAAKEQYEYNLHLYTELEKANLKAEEQEALEQQLDKENNIEEIKLNLTEAQALALNEEIGIQALLVSFTANLNKIKSFASEYKELYDRVSSLKIEMDDVITEIENLNENVEFDPSELEKLNDRLQLIYNLQKKHTVNSITELLVIKENLSLKVDAVQNSSSAIKAKETEIKSVAEKIDKLAVSIFNERKKAIPVLIKKLELILSNLGMENTRFQFKINHTKNYLSNGKDELHLLISANKGVNFGELKKIASGGELSRIMLAVKAILSEYSKLPTIIFDEIDTGVSGDVSQKMADIMQQMSDNMQVITITHLPQIAAKGQHHYKVYKEDIDNNIITQLTRLNKKERIKEIAEMLSGKNISETAIEHAKQLLN
ncbi:MULTISPECIES: DNA repair protein RecN [Flavobacteriaceae]|uniref:DNA repair protein RecN n=2 Tax=Flavobacteriaceae TaxID=49546 RepID=A0A4Y8AUC8_9FLAO|nr:MULTISPECIES: DNA repair protein RecN [Flavobacteriaceae]TEW75427.1 DNA repair protein RecN [Gramella jeungdoensis]GGK45108.1 DNA repair protein RecN [Lutibacter litoralis]